MDTTPRKNIKPCYITETPEFARDVYGNCVPPTICRLEPISQGAVRKMTRAEIMRQRRLEALLEESD